MRIEHVSQLLIRAVIIGLCLIATFTFQIHYLSAFDVGQRISLFYIPAAVITLSALTLRQQAAFGVFLGYGVINLVMHDEYKLDAIILSLTPPVVMVLTIALLSLVSRRIGHFFGPSSTLADIDAFDILLFCAGYGIVNASLHNLLFYLDPTFATPVSALSVVQMMFGDLTGSFLGFIGLNLSYSVMSRLIRTKRPRGGRV